MKREMIDAVLKAYRVAKPHLVEGLPKRTPVQVLVVFRLGDLQELEAQREAEREWDKEGATTILSGG